MFGLRTRGVLGEGSESLTARRQLRRLTLSSPYLPRSQTLFGNAGLETLFRVMAQTRNRVSQRCVAKRSLGTRIDWFASFAILGSPLFEEIGEQVIEIALRDQVGPVGRHGRKLRHAPFFDRVLWNANLLALPIGHDQHFALFSKQQTCDRLTVLEGERCSAKCLIDVAVGIKDVFQQTIDAPDADAIELRANLGALAAKLVAVRTVLLVNLRSDSQICFCGGEANPAPLEEFLQMLVGRRQSLGQLGKAFF